MLKKIILEDADSFESLWNVIFNQGDLKIQELFLVKLKPKFNIKNDIDITELIAKDLINHPNERTRRLIADFVAAVCHRMQMGASYNTMIEKALSDIDSKVRMRILEATIVYTFFYADTEELIPSTPAIIDKSMHVYGEVLKQPRYENYEIIGPLRVLGARAGVYSKELSQAVLDQNYRNRHVLMINLAETAEEFHQFFPLIRSIFESSQDDDLIESALVAIDRVASFTDLYCSRIKELVPLLLELRVKAGLSENVYELIENVLKTIEIGPV